MGVAIREKPKGSGVWWVFINHNGKRKSKRVGDKKAVCEVAEKIKARLVLGEFDMNVSKEDRGPFFKEYAEKCLLLPRDWKESTREVYRDFLRIHVYPVFAKTRIIDIRRKDLKSFFDDLLIKGRAPATVALVRASVNMVLAEAVDSEIIESNPLSDLKLRLKRKRSIAIIPLDETEADKLLEQAKVFMDGVYYPSILCALRTGLRIGELQALKWDDMNFAERLIEVKRSWRKNRITGTKSKKNRRVDMTPYLAEVLKQLRIEQKKNALKRGCPVPEWVFANKKGEMLNRMTFKNALDRCLNKAGLRKIRIHDLRHSYATMRLLRGHNVGDVSYQLGHSSIKITYDVYGHWTPGRFKSEVDELDIPLQIPANGCV